MTAEGSVRVDSWLWAVRLTKTRSAATAACRAGHVRINGGRAKAAAAVRVGDEISARLAGRQRIVVVQRLVVKRVGAAVATDCLIDRSPAPAPLTEAPRVATRDRGAGRPTKRERREIDRLRGRG